MENVVQPLKKFKKNSAIDLRKKGFSYSEIQNRLKVPKSTLSLWLGKVELTDEQQKKLKDKRTKIAKANSEKRILKTSELIEKIKDSSSDDVKNISKRELWLMGIILYWKERLVSGNDTDLKNGVRFTSSDPDLIKLFLKWLEEVGGIKEDEIKFDLFLKKDDNLSTEFVRKSVAHWSEVTDFPKDKFLEHVYFQKDNQSNRNKKTGTAAKKANRATGKAKQDQNLGARLLETDEIKKGPQFGLLRIRVRASSMLARQIAGWAKGIQKTI